MSLDRKRRRVDAKKRFRVLAGGKAGAPPPPPTASTQDRLGQALKILIEQFRTQDAPLTRFEEVKVLLQTAAHFSLDQDADPDQFGRAAAHIFEAYVRELPPLRPPPAG